MILIFLVKLFFVPRLHSWGDTLEEAFEQCAMSMFGYMTEIEYVEMTDYQEITAEGEDLLSLLYHFLDEFLFLFSADPFFIARVSYKFHHEFKIIY